MLRLYAVKVSERPTMDGVKDGSLSAQGYKGPLITAGNAAHENSAGTDFAVVSILMRVQRWLLAYSLVFVLAVSALGQTGERLWETYIGGDIETAPAIDETGTICAVTKDLFGGRNVLVGLNPDGTKKFEIVPPAGFFTSGISIASDGTIYVGRSDRRLIAYNQDGTEKWSLEVDTDHLTTPAIGDDGTLYIGGWSGTLYAISDQGVIKWSRNLGAAMHEPASVSSSGVIYVATSYAFFVQNFVYAYDLEGTLLWKFPIPHTEAGAISVGDDGTAYFSDGLTLFAFQPDGTTKWQLPIDHSFFRTPVIAKDGTLYLGGKGNTMFAVNPDGTIKWEFKASGGVRYSPAIDDDGNLYFGADSGDIYCVGPDGRQLWKYSVAPSTLISHATISQDSVVYFGSGSLADKLVALKAYSGAATGPWPMYGHNPRHTSREAGRTAFKFAKHPEHASRGEGSDVSFTVSVNGDGPITFQWRHNGTNIIGATNASYSIPLVRSIHAGSYDVAVSNESGNGVSAAGILTVLESGPFVERILPLGYYAESKLTVFLKAAPSKAAKVYAVEENPPSGWRVNMVSHGGIYDSANHKVKFGPFVDNEPRDLRYELIPPTAGTAIVNVFSGTGSIEGINTRVAGSDRIDLNAIFHPGDNNPADNRISIEEVTTYASSWKRGTSWPIEPNPIPIEFMTRAGFLWKGGENYFYDSENEELVLRWVNDMPSASASEGAISSNRKVKQNLTSKVVASFPDSILKESTFTVTLQVTPASTVSVYAIQDEAPNGWSISAVSEGGEQDSINNLIKWGPFFDNKPRTLTYEVRPSFVSGAPYRFEGIGSFDGKNISIVGSRLVQRSVERSIAISRISDRTELQIPKEEWQSWKIQSSLDLVQWTDLEASFNTNGVLNLDPYISGSNRKQFFRLVSRNKE